MAIINTTDLPSDLDFIDAWTIDDAELTDAELENDNNRYFKSKRSLEK